MAAMASAAAYGNAALDRKPLLEDSDQDAEGEEDVEVYQPIQPFQDGATTPGQEDNTCLEGEQQQNNVLDVEMKVGDEEEIPNAPEEEGVAGTYEEAPATKATQLPEAELHSGTDADEGDDASYHSEFSGSGAKAAPDVVSSSEEESEAEEEWEAESNDQDDAEAEQASLNLCIVCGQDEEHDPCEEFEECLSCAVCGDHCHRQCGRERGCFNSEDDPETWRCPSCVQNKLEPDTTEKPRPKRRSIPSNIARDLLPVYPDGSAPDSHSIFNALIIDGDPLDGSRSLRKRKSSVEAIERHRPVTRKRQKLEPGESERPGTSGSQAQIGPGENEADAILAARPRRTRNAQKSFCSVLVRQQGKLVVAFRLDGSRLGKILNSRRRPQPPRRRPPKPPQAGSEEPRLHFAPVNPSPYTAPFYTFHDRENDELKSKPYGGILSENDADTSKTLPLQTDRERFEAARRKAEEEWRQKVTLSEPHGGAPRASQKLSGPPSKIKCVNFGGYEIETWYAAPYPEEYSRNRVLYICEFCLKYMSSDFVAWRHKLKCPAKHPPGDEIYRDGTVSIFEVDGRKNPVYCQNLCLLAKLFLGSKTLYYDVEPFLFYVMTEYDELGCHFVGYFSKEKRPSSSNNVSCILTLPIHQRKGYGNLLIDFSYLLTRIERKTGSPEKPLSDMGLVSYRNYWRLVLCYQLRDQSTPISVAGLAERTGMTADDVVSGLESLRALVRDPLTKTYALRLDYDYYEEQIRRWEDKGYVRLNPHALVWTPFIMGRSNQSHYDRAPIHAVAPREENEGERPGVDGNGDGGVEGKAKGRDFSSGLENMMKQATTNGHASQAKSASPPFEPPGPPSTSVLSYGDVSSNHTAGSRYGSATPSNPASGIPPTRFEIFPPLNGTGKRRPGRPFGSTKNRARHAAAASAAARSLSVASGRTTPKRNTALSMATPTPASRPIGLRRGRSSRLADNVLSMDESGDEDKGLADAKVADEEDLARETPIQEPEQANTNGEPSEEQGQTKSSDDGLVGADPSDSISTAAEDRLPNGDKHDDELPGTIAAQADVQAEINGSATPANDAPDSALDAIMS